jgi:hypothetical protein
MCQWYKQDVDGTFKKVDTTVGVIIPPPQDSGIAAWVEYARQLTRELAEVVSLCLRTDTSVLPPVLREFSGVLQAANSADHADAHPWEPAHHADERTGARENTPPDEPHTDTGCECPF